MHHCLIANLGLEISWSRNLLVSRSLGLEILNEIIALIRIAHLGSTLSAGKKIIPPLVLCLGRASLARRWVLDRAHRGSRRAGFAGRHLYCERSTSPLIDADGTRRSGRASLSLRYGCGCSKKSQVSSCQTLSSNFPKWCDNKSCTRPSCQTPV